MYKKLIVFSSIFTLFMSACSAFNGELVEPNVTPVNNIKTFAAEDVYIMYALRAQQIGDSKAAAQLFYTLYEKSGKKEYLYKALTHQIILKEYKEVITKVDAVNVGTKSDLKLVRLKIISLSQIQEYEKAQIIAVPLVEKSQLTSDYLMLSNLLIKEEKYKLAVKYLEKAYVKSYDEKILDKLSIILFVNLHQEKEAIAKLETHSRLRSCSQTICNRLIGMYGQNKNIDGILSTYLRMYEKNLEDAIAKKIMQIYGYQKDYTHMITFLEKYNVDEETLLELYSMRKNYAKAFILADKLYKNSGDIAYLGQSAIYEYESIQKHNDKKIIKSVIKKLEVVVKKEKNPLYENYLGYVLIDHEIDIEKGMKHIENVLKVKPDSAYYLDSLAWGYYKLHQCSKAKTIMDRVVTFEGGDDPEVLKHVEKINKCMKINKGKK